MPILSTPIACPDGDVKDHRCDTSKSMPSGLGFAMCLQYFGGMKFSQTDIQRPSHYSLDCYDKTDRRSRRRSGLTCAVLDHLCRCHVDRRCPSNRQDQAVNRVERFRWLRYRVPFLSTKQSRTGPIAIGNFHLSAPRPVCRGPLRLSPQGHPDRQRRSDRLADLAWRFRAEVTSRTGGALIPSRDSGWTQCAGRLPRAAVNRRTTANSYSHAYDKPVANQYSSCLRRPPIESSSTDNSTLRLHDISGWDLPHRAAGLPSVSVGSKRVRRRRAAFADCRSPSRMA